GFIGEFLVMLGAFRTSTFATAVICTGIILGAAYMLYLYRKVMFGAVTKDEVRAMPDLSFREILCLAPIAAIVLWMGVAPNVFIDPVRAPVAAIVARLEPTAPHQQTVVAAAAAKPQTTAETH